MCLLIKKIGAAFPKPKIAKEDIKVYKVLTEKDFGRFQNLYINGEVEPWTEGFIYTETGGFKILYDDYYMRIEGGCFHSCKTHKHALTKVGIFGSYKVVKMIIPKGTKYYEDDKEYASKSIYYAKK